MIDVYQPSIINSAAVSLSNYKMLAVGNRQSSVIAHQSVIGSQRSAVNCLRNLIIAAFLVIFSIGCKSTKEIGANKQINHDTQSHEEVQIDTAGKFAKIVFDSSSYHFGQIKQGQLLHREIYFTNMGPGDLLIDLISACECTALDWSRLPIRSGSRSAIKVIYNSKDKEGPQIVDIDVTANTNPGSTYAKFSLFVEK